jgi:hypothetical protein
MDKGYIQNLRYKLQKRVRKLNSTPSEYFHIGLKQFWGFINSYEIFKGILEDLKNRLPSTISDVDKIIDGNQALFGESELESAALSYFVIKRCVENENERIEVNIAHNYSNESKHEDALENWKDIFLETFYDYLDEQLDDQRAILALLRRYKHKCEWFNREKLFTLWEQNTKKGEKLLAMHLYEYLFDQGIDFFIEPASISGEADLVNSQIDEEPLVADVKIFNPLKSKASNYICSGFRQVYQYLLDYNESFGYLIIFKTCEEDLKFSLKPKEEFVPFITHNNKSIFLITIDIFIYEKSASKRGRLKTVEITETDLVNVINKS